MYYVFRVYVCSLSYPEGKTRAPHYIVFSGVSSSSIYFNVTSYRQDFLKNKNLSQNLYFDVPCNFCPKISHPKKYPAKYYHKFTDVFTQSSRYSVQILLKVEFSVQIFPAFRQYKIR